MKGLLLSPDRPLSTDLPHALQAWSSAAASAISSCMRVGRWQRRPAAQHLMLRTSPWSMSVA